MGYLYLWRCVCEISTARKLAIKVLWVTALRKLTGGICSTVYSVAATGGGGNVPKKLRDFLTMIKILAHVGFWIVLLFKNCTCFFWFTQQMFSPSWPIMSRSDLSWDPLSSGLNSGRPAILGKMLKQTKKYLWFSPQSLSTYFLLISASFSSSATRDSPLLLSGVPPRIEVHSWTHSHWGARRICPFYGEF